MDQGAVLSNLAHCTEHLGNLRRARDLQLRAQKVASNSGAVPLEIVSLVNLGSMETKLGNTRKAEQLFEKAIDWIDRLRRRNWQFDVDRLAVAYADATLHFVKTGKYRGIADRPDGGDYGPYRRAARAGRSRHWILAGVFGGALGVYSGRGTGFSRFGEHPLGFLEVRSGHLHLKLERGNLRRADHKGRDAVGFEHTVDGVGFHLGIVIGGAEQRHQI